MKSEMKTTIAMLALLATTMPSNAATRNYFTPQQDGMRLSSCLADNMTCGKAVADAFCKAEGFSESILFAREPVSEARMFGDGPCVAAPNVKPSPASSASRMANNRQACSKNWWARQDSNLEPDGYEPSALTIELQAHPARYAQASCC
jgi:hypothetical protein